MTKYKKNKTVTLNGTKYICDAWDIAGYLNSRGVNIERIINNGGYLLRFNHYEKGESGKRILMSIDQYNEIADSFDLYDTLKTWTIPFLNYIGK